jgi:hypothetical protein
MDSFGDYDIERHIIHILMYQAKIPIQFPTPSYDSLLTINGDLNLNTSIITRHYCML